MDFAAATRRRGLSSYFRFAPRRGGGLLFARAKRSKRSLKELRSLRILLNDGSYFVLRFHCSPSGLKQAAPMDQTKRLPDDVNGRPYRLTRGSSRKGPREIQRV